MDREKAEEQIVEEGLDDWINFSTITRSINGNEDVETREEPILSWLAVDVASDLVVRGIIVPGDLTRDGFTPWVLEPAEAVRRLHADARAVIAEYGYIPLAEVCWFGLPEYIKSPSLDVRTTPQG